MSFKVGQQIRIVGPERIRPMGEIDFWDTRSVNLTWSKRPARVAEASQAERDAVKDDNAAILPEKKATGIRDKKSKKGKSQKAFYKELSRKEPTWQREKESVVSKNKKARHDYTVQTIHRPVWKAIRQN